MCNNCNQQALAALEAIANGEEIPEAPAAPLPFQLPEGVELEGALIHRPNFDLPFPVIAFETSNGNVGILTNQDGWKFVKGALVMLGECGHDHH